MRHLFSFMLLVMFLCMISNKILAYNIAIPNEDGVWIFYNIINGGSELEVTSAMTIESSIYGHYSFGYEGIESLNIPTEVEYAGIKFKVTGIGKYAFTRTEYYEEYERYSLTSVTFPNSLKYIGEEAFYGCNNLISITLPNSLESIGEKAFCSCDNITTINLPKGIKSIGNYAFLCSNLESVTISSTSAFSISESAFPHLRRIEYLSDDIVDPLFDISSLSIDTVVVSTKAYTRIAENSGWEKCDRIYARGEDSKLYIGIKNEYNSIVSVNGITNQTIVLIPHDQKAYIQRTSSSPSEMYVMINGESSVLTSDNSSMLVSPSPYNSLVFNVVYVINRNTSGTNDQTITITESGTLISQVGRDNLEILKRLKIIGDINGSDILAIRKMINLEELDLSQANIVEGGSSYYQSDSQGIYHTLADRIGDCFFKDMQNLLVLHLPESGKVIGRKVFDGCSKLQEVTIPGSFTYIDENAFSNSGIKKVIFKESERYIYIEKTAFENTFLSTIELFRDYKGSLIFENTYNNPYRSLRYLTLDGSFTNIPNNYEFTYCTSLASLIVGARVERIGEHNFGLCKSLENVIFKDSENEITLSGISSHGEFGFFNHSPINSLYCGRNISEPVFKDWQHLEYYNHTFMDLSLLSNLTISENVTKIASFQFKGCISLHSVSLPNSIKTINECAFEACENLCEMILPNKLNLIGDNAFRGCKSLNKIDIPSSVTIIGSEAFSGCSAITSINIGENVKKIEANTFSGCSSLQEVRLGENISVIEDNAFENCSNIKKIYSWNPIPPTVSNTSLSGINKNACTLYVPKGSGDLYWLHPEWGQFFEIKEVESENIRTTKMDDTTLNYYRIDGQQRMVPEKGINILRMSDGTTKKVYIK